MDSNCKNFEAVRVSLDLALL